MRMKKHTISAILMMVAILVITGFQVYWLKNNYDREKQSLELKTSAAFRQTILQLQSQKLKLETFNLVKDSGRTATADVAIRRTPRRVSVKMPQPAEEQVVDILNLLQEKIRDSLRSQKGRIVIRSGSTDSMMRGFNGTISSISISTDMDSLMRLNPDLIQEVHVNRKKDSGSTIIIGMKDRPVRTLTRDSFRFHERGEPIVIDNKVIPVPTMPLPPGEEMQADKKNNMVFRFLYNMDSLTLKDSVTVKEVDSAFAQRLKTDKINIGFAVNRLDSVSTSLPNAVTIGFSKPATYSYSLMNTFNYYFGKLKLPLLFSLLLIGITIASFVLLYRNMMRQKRLADLKNEFISNITHELKTPIATVGVAIEALKSFNAIDNPVRTQEYLSISQNELQRLNLLVDKVLKLSMFEKKEVELKYELLNLPDIVDEVVASMRLQIEKHRAVVSVNTEGDCSLQADRLHLLSVVFNLLDNALKYGSDAPQIKINMEEKENSIELKVADNGIGIPADYVNKVFDKFFRVPHGDTHNAKGYGLGLSYVAHVIKKHKGTISVQSETGKGSTFVINLPKQTT